MSTSSILLSQKKILMHFKNRFKVYLKYTSLLNSWWIQSISEKYKAFSKLFSSCFQSYKLWKSQFCLKVYLKYTSEVYLKYSVNSAGENTSRGLHNLWGNGLVVRVQGYQTRDPTFETTRWLKNWLSLSYFKNTWGLGG